MSTIGRQTLTGFLLAHLSTEMVEQKAMGVDRNYLPAITGVRPIYDDDANYEPAIDVDLDSGVTYRIMITELKIIQEEP